MKIFNVFYYINNHYERWAVMAYNDFQAACAFWKMHRAKKLNPKCAIYCIVEGELKV